MSHVPNNIKPMAMVSILIFTLLSFLSSTRAQGRAPHGIVYESPMAFSPSAFDFFHPNTKNPGSEDPCVTSNCSPLPLAATVASTLAYKSRSTQEKGGGQVGAGGVAGIVFGFVCAVLLAMGVYYVVVKRRANLTRSNSVQPDA
ncbi:Protein HEG 1 like [Actinidia chinensis var. chinensis]|uniref:Protein HEG 1 like n=1 Tax=Actinidia chinensis var. chinensis TaxID=1590841 RepID=A0A2R6PQ32_ACTCC|nr:Protein HEG 1 like [Actinidia chinensis var. chinensis]